MDINGFWQIIDEVHAKSGGDMDTKCELLQGTLHELSDGELVDFEEFFTLREVEAYRWDIWAVAYLLNGGCGDDSFMDFRATLISLGRKNFEAALADPGSIPASGIDLEDPCHEGFQYVAMEICGARELETRLVETPEEPSGAPWEEDAVAELYPEIAKVSVNWE